MPRLLIPLLIFASFGLLFAVQACPIFYFWDSAELTAAVLSNGVPHPPGFPTFLILAEIWNWLIPANPAHALNLFSAFFAALGLVLWYLVIKKTISGLDFHRPSVFAAILALIPTVLMGVSFSYGIQATRFEVYSLNFAGFAALTLLAFKIRRQEHGFASAGILFFVILGLMLGVHNLTIALSVPGLLLLMRGSNGPGARQIVAGIALALAIASGLYMIIYLRAQGNSALNWGDPSNMKSLLDYIFIKDFSTSIKGGLFGHIIDEIGFVIGLMSRQVGIPGLLLAVIGAIYLGLNSHGVGRAILVILGFNLLSISLAASYFYENFDLHGYLIISLAVVALCLAVGLEFIYQAVSRKASTASVKGISSGGAVISVAIGLAICIGPCLNNFLSADLSRVTAAGNIAEDYLDNSPDGAVILTSSYNTYFSLLAKQALSNRYDDRVIINIYNWDHEWGRRQTNRMLGLDIKTESSRQNYYRALVNVAVSRRPIYVEYDYSSRPLARYLHPQGLGYLLSVDTTGIGQESSPDDVYFSRARGSNDIESIRTWVLWLQCRGEYYRDRGLHDLADRYFATLNTVASNANIK
ncbi:MAG: hypothetical protein A2W25_02600 [candidate division Zixibacteria bacterium RBG_16_53_22]|nr:MAG: hypothetical protein A2W25_02600 [candidate division Zixibacteria bacterium RBG_16_53_22]